MARVQKPLVALLLLSLFVAAPVHAQDDSGGDDDDESSREEDIFGETTSSETIDQRLAEANDPLAIGGSLYLRFEYFTLENGHLEDFPFSSPNFLDVYLDARPSDRVRAYFNTRVRHDFTVKTGDTDVFGQPVEPTSLDIDQLWLKFDVQRRVFLTLGRQRIKWGTGRIWNPTDFLNRQRRDPLALFDERLGVSLVKVHVPIESQGWNFYGIADLDGARTPEEIGAAGRAEFLFGSTEIALSGSLRKDNPYRLGVDVSSALSVFDVRAEAAVVHLDDTPFFRGEFRPQDGVLPETYSRRDDWIPQATVGGDIEIGVNEGRDSLFLGLEYFYNDAGYDNADLYPWLFVTGTYQPFYVGRHYASAFALLMGPGNWDDTRFLLTAISNLSDGSYLTRFDYGVLLYKHVNLSIFANYHFGEVGELHLGVDIPPVPTVPGLENGLHIPPQQLDLGVWLSVSI